MRNRGRRNEIPYVPFEALKARDFRLEPVPHHYYYEDIRKDLKKPQRSSGVSRATLFTYYFTSTRSNHGVAVSSRTRLRSSMFLRP